MFSRYHLSFRLLSAAVSLLAFTSCIENDIPYPRERQDITAIAAVGQVRPASISTESLTAVLYLDETTDITDVVISQFEVTQGAEVNPDLLNRAVDLSAPLTVSLSKYQTYEWTVSAVQEIERYFTVRNQIGPAEIDPLDKTVSVVLPENSDLSAVEITSIKLGPRDITTLTPSLSSGSVIDLSRPLEIRVEAHGQSETWTISASRSSHLVDITDAAAWSMVIWATAHAPESPDNGFRYRQAGSDRWIEVPKENITFGDGTFTACIPHLTPLTEYVIQAYSGAEVSSQVQLKTQATQILPDGSFDDWWKNGNIWCPWAQDGDRFWDTGNTGAATLGQSNVVPSDHTPDGQGLAAMLQSRFVGIAGIGKFAAGSIYTGSFAKVDGTNGILDFGRPWTLRPTKLKGFYQYTTSPINYVSSEFKESIGKPDTLCIYIALADWTAPYVIRTNPRNRRLFDKNDPSIIAYGEIVSPVSTDGYVPFEIRLDYRDYFKTPSYIQITCAASKLGDYFTGGTGTVLYVDQLSLDYDY